jgi:hypothetical protein
MRCLVLCPHPRHIRRPRPSHLKIVMCRLESRHRTGRRKRAPKEVDGERNVNSMCESHEPMSKWVVVPRHGKSVSCLSYSRFVLCAQQRKRRIRECYTFVFIAKARHGHGHGHRGSGSRRHHHHGHSSEHKNEPTSPDPFAMGKSTTYFLSCHDLLISDLPSALTTSAKHLPKRNTILWTLLSW